MAWPIETLGRPSYMLYKLHTLQYGAIFAHLLFPALSLAGNTRLYSTTRTFGARHEIK